MTGLVALIDMGGTFTKLATIDAISGKFVSQHKYPSELLWLRKDMVANRIFAELQASTRSSGLAEFDDQEAALRNYEHVYLSFAGKFQPGGRLVDLAYVKKWQKAWQEQNNPSLPTDAIWPDSIDLARALGVNDETITMAVDKLISGIGYLNRNQARDGAILTLGTGVGLVRLVGGKISDDVTARTVLLDSRLSGRSENLHDFIGGNHIKEMAQGTTKDIRRSLSFRLVRALLAVEDALIAKSGHKNYLLEIAGGGAMLYDAVSVIQEFEQETNSGTEIRFLLESDFNNLHGLAYLHLAKRSVSEFIL